MRVSVRTSLIALVLVLGATLGAQSWLAMSHIGVVFNSAADLAVNWMPNARTAQRLNYLLAGLRGLEGEMVSTTNPAELGTVAKANAEQVQLLEAQRKDYENRRAGSEEKAAYDAFSQLWTEYRGQHDQLIALAEKNDMAAAAKIFRGPLSALFDKMNPLVRSIVVANGKGGERSWADAQATYASIMWIMSVSLAIAALIVVAALVFVIRAVTSPISRLTKAMREVAGGNLAVAVPFADRRNEIGDMARALERFRSDLTEAERNRAATTAAEERSAETLKQAREAIARQFQSKMGALADAFVETAAELSNAAGDLSATAEETSRRAKVVSGAAEEAAESVQTAAASTEEMSASIREISSQMTKSTEIADTAANEAARTESDVRALSDAASKIGEVVELINNIAGQTNLLALNATIEAARAGEAGRGFAVVASEVKQLAAQTARATDEIGTKINEIQQATSRTVGSIERIVATVSQIQEISTIIASTIEEQGAATSEIASNTQLASRGAGDVTRNIVGVSDAAELTGTAATRLTGLSGNLNSQAGALQSEVIEFVRQLRAG